LADFSREVSRESMRVALAEVRKQLGATYPPIIDGKPVPTAETFETLNPSHLREVVGRCGKSSPEQARLAVEAAQRAFPAWRDTDPHERADALVRTAAALRRR